jgi:serralysin
MNRTGLLVTLFAVFSGICRCEAQSLGTNAAGLVLYTAFDGTPYTLRPWLGRNIVILTPTTTSYQAAVMSRIIASLDRAYDAYESVTAHRPSSFDSTTFLGRDTIAIVNSTCGAGCSYVGFTGTEILPTYFMTLYNEASVNQYDQVLFYEFGRSFWSYSQQLAYQWPDSDPVTTGFAVYMRFVSMDLAGLAGGPFNGNSFTTFRAAVTNLVDTYVRSGSLNWSNTFRLNTAPPNSLGLSGTDFIASILMRIGRDFGGPHFAVDFWKQAGLRPVAISTLGAADNFVLAASAAVQANLTGVFASTWKWPVSPAAVQEALMRWGNPVRFQPRYVIAQTAPGQLTLSWQTGLGGVYQPQESTDLTTWFDVGDPLSGDGLVHKFTVPSNLFLEHFFRLQTQ